MRFLEREQPEVDFDDFWAHVVLQLSPPAFQTSRLGAKCGNALNQFKTTVRNQPTSTDGVLCYRIL